MIVKKSIALWDHVPSLEELREIIRPCKDLTVEQFPEETNLEFYLKYTGLRIYTNGRDLKEAEPNIKSEMKYVIKSTGIYIPEYVIPSKEHYILV